MPREGRNLADPTDKGMETPKDLESALQQIEQLKSTLGVMTKNWMAAMQRADMYKDDLDNIVKQIKDLQRALTSEKMKKEQLRDAASKMKAGLGSRGVNDFKKTMNEVLQDR